MITTSGTLIRSIHETPQQFLAGEIVSKDLEYKLGRACTMHCVSVARDEITSDEPTSADELVDFIDRYGAGTKSEYYPDSRGWNIIALANLMRMQDIPVVSQNLRIGSEHSDFDAAVAVGRATNILEKSRLNLYRSAGGSDRNKWLLPLISTLSSGGQVVASIQIPLLSGEGFGSHAVLIRDIDEQAGTVTYFDPDYYNTKRFGDKAPPIDRIDNNKLLYARPIEDQLSVMTGEAIHVFRPRG